MVKKVSLIAASKVKAYIKNKGMMISSDVLDAINNKLYLILNFATEQSRINNRSTVKAIYL